MVKGCQHLDVPPAEGLGAEAINVLFGTVIYGVYRVNRTVPERKIIGMFGNRSGVPGPGTDNYLSPLIGVKPFTFEEIVKILVAEIMQAPVSLYMVKVLG
jgi:hypothetical protein